MKTKHLLSGVAVIAALALSAPAWAQPANPSGGNRGYAGSQPRWAGSDAEQHGRSSSGARPLG